MSKGKKGVKKRTVDPFTRKDEYSVNVSVQCEDVWISLTGIGSVHLPD